MRADEHHADAEVEHTRPLTDRLAQRGKQEGRGEANTRRQGGDQNGNGEELAHGASSPTAVARSIHSAMRLRHLREPTTNTTTTPLIARMSAAGTEVRVASDAAGQHPPEQERAGTVARCRPPNSAATMPLNRRSA